MSISFKLDDGEIRELVEFMAGEDNKVLVSMLNYFSFPTPGLKAKYLHPRELKAFWETLTEAEKDAFRIYFAFRTR